MLGVLVWAAVLSTGAAIVLLQGIRFWWERDVIRGVAYTATALFMAVAITAVSVASFAVDAVEKKFAEYGITKDQVSEFQQRRQ